LRSLRIQSMRCFLLSVVCLSSLTIVPAAENPKPTVQDKIRDRYIPATFENPDAPGYLAERMKLNTELRLLRLDLDSILKPFQQRPGAQAWMGEHVGKFLHAGSLVWRQTRDERLKLRIDKAARELMATQLPDGYLGTYREQDRWTSWDVWTHKYNMIGLLSYYSVTGDVAALESCRKMADLLYRVFVEEKRDIIRSGEHVGMAPTSILEPMAVLFRQTGEPRYLEFCRYILRSWEQPHGPKILSSLLDHGQVNRTANAKAYEMLSCLVGLLELYRLTGEPDYRKACDNAWDDIVKNRLYLHGSASWEEFFQTDGDLRPDGTYKEARYIAGAEGCVTVTWLQFNLHLLRLTGNPKYADELQRTIYNALLGAQSPLTGQVCYFAPLQGRKRYGEVNHGILPDVSCCASSIPRGIALIPDSLAGWIDGVPAILDYTNGKLIFHPIDGRPGLNVTVRTDYPLSGSIELIVEPESETAFPLLLAIPEWARDFEARVGDRTYRGEPGRFLRIEKNWAKGEIVRISLPLAVRVVADNHAGSSRVALFRGPQMLAVDENIDLVKRLPRWGWHGKQLYRVSGVRDGKPVSLFLVPYAEAGQSMADYQALVEGFTSLREESPQASPE